MIYLEINGTPLEGFTNVRVSRSYQSVPAQFTFSATVSPEDLTKFPVTVGDRCRILVQDVVYCDGFVDEISPRHNNDTHEIDVKGASKVVDLVESCMDGTYDVKGPTTLKEALEGIIFKSGCDIKVINETDNEYKFEENEIIAGQIGNGVWDHMLKCAIKKNALISETASGDIRITTGAGARISTTLTKKVSNLQNNILGSNMRLSHAERYHVYTVLSQEDSTTMSFDDETDASEGSDADYSDIAGEPASETSADDNKGTAFDVAIRNSRKKAMMAESASNGEQCLERAIWQSNTQRAQSFGYNCTVQGFFYDTGELIEPGQVVNVEDVYMSISSDLIIDSVTFSYNLRQGSKTRMSMLLPDAFTLKANQPTFEETGNETGFDYSDVTGDPESE